MHNLNKRNFDLEKRARFTSTFSQTPYQLQIFNTTLQNVLGGTAEIVELKKSAREAESLILGWKDYCEDIRFFSLQTLLFDVFENWETIISYIYSIPNESRTHHIKELKHLWMHCNQDIDLPRAISICYHLQEDIIQTLKSPLPIQEDLLLQSDGRAANTSQFYHIPPPQTQHRKMTDDNFANAFCPELKESLRADDREEHKNDDELRKAFIASFSKTYVITSKGIPVLKSSLGSGLDRLKDPGDIPRD